MIVHSPLVSVLIPLYKVERFIERCLLSVFRQTYSSLQIIIVDDASPDNSRAIAEKLIKAHKKEDVCKLIVHEQNKGLAGARKTAIELSTGEYMFFLDSDDYWDSEDFVSCCIEKATQCNSQVLITDYIADYRKKQVYYPQRPPGRSGRICAHALLKGELQGFLTNKCFESAHYKQFALKHTRGQNLLEDLRSIFPLFLHTDRIDYLPIPSIHYEQKNESSYISTIKTESLAQLFSAIDDCREYANSLSDPSEFEADFEIAYLNAAKMFYDKAPFSQYKTIKEYRVLNPKKIRSMQYHLLIRFRFLCQLSDSFLMRYLGYFLCKIEQKMKRIMRA